MSQTTIEDLIAIQEQVINAQNSYIASLEEQIKSLNDLAEVSKRLIANLDKQIKHYKNPFLLSHDMRQ